MLYILKYFPMKNYFTVATFLALLAIPVTGATDGQVNPNLFPADREGPPLPGNCWKLRCAWPTTGGMPQSIFRRLTVIPGDSAAENPKTGP